MPEVSLASDQRWFTVAQAAAYLQFSQIYIRKLMHQGEIKAARFGHDYRIEKYDLDQLVLRRKQTLKPYRKGTKPWVAKMHADKRRKKARRG